jgi:hypothetical protein
MDHMVALTRAATNLSPNYLYNLMCLRIMFSNDAERVRSSVIIHARDPHMHDQEASRRWRAV